MKHVLIAGASGYLGRHLVTAAKKRGYSVRVLLRRKPDADMFEIQPDEIFIGEVVKPETLEGLCKDIDYVVSSLGITRQKDGLRYDDVDYRGNMNILDCALKAGVKSFVYVSVFNAHLLLGTSLVAAKEHFVEDLKKADIHSCIIRPTGFFSDMKDFLDMAARGKVFLFGDGELMLNPIHGADLAEEIFHAREQGKSELNIGGPETYSVGEIARMAIKATGNKCKVVFVPDILRKMLLFLLPIFTPATFYGPIQFFLAAMGYSGAAPEYGTHTLEEYFKAEARQISSE